MKAAYYEQTRPAERVLVVGDLPDPQPAADEVRVRLE
jgi:NADPH:quinone reductase